MRRDCALRRGGCRGFQPIQIGNGVRRALSAHFPVRPQAATHGGTLRLAEKQAAVVFAELDAADAGRLARRHARYWGTDRRGDTACPAAGSAFHRASLTTYRRAPEFHGSTIGIASRAAIQLMKNSSRQSGRCACRAPDWLPRASPAVGFSPWRACSGLGASAFLSARPYRRDNVVVLAIQQTDWR